MLYLEDRNEDINYVPNKKFKGSRNDIISSLSGQLKEAIVEKMKIPPSLQKCHYYNSVLILCMTVYLYSMQKDVPFTGRE